jgi:ATP-binding cassette subfamily B protein
MSAAPRSVTRKPEFVRLLNGFGLEFLATVLVLSLLSAAEGVLHPLLIKNIFDEGVLRSDFGKFLTFAVAYLAFGLVANVAGAATAMWARSLENRIVATTSRDLLGAYYAKEYESVLLNGHGYFINRIYGDVQEGFVPLLRLIQSATSQVLLVIA